MNYRIYNKRYIFIGISALIIVVGIMAAYFSGIILDIQFKGGSVITYTYEGELNTDDVNSKLSSALELDVSNVQDNYNEALDMKSISISISGTKTLSVKEKSAIDKLFAEDEILKELNFKLYEEITVDPSIGKTYLRNGIMALVIAAVLIILYVWYRFRSMSGPSAGIMALMVLSHDLLIVFAAFVLLKIPLNENLIAVLLTIIGYSINNTIVIYDRIRENMALDTKNTDLGELVDHSIIQTMSRSINTTVTTLGTMLITYIFASIYGIASVQNFALPMIIGLLAGFYSSVFLAGPTWVMWKTRGGRTGF